MNKKIYLCSIVFCLCFKVNSQTIFIHDKAALKKYEGVWQWINNNDTLTINLRIDSLHKSQRIKDSSTEKLVLYCWSRYTENGTLIEDNLIHAADLKKCSGLGTVTKDSSGTYFGMSFYEALRDQNFNVVLSNINKKGDKVCWKSHPRERWGKQTDTKNSRGIPSCLQLEKVSDRPY